MALSERTLKKLRDESVEVGGKVYGDDDVPDEQDVTHLDEDDDPLSNAGDPVEDDDNDTPVGEVPNDEEENS